MDPELKQAHADVTELMNKVHPHFHGHNSFVVMMTLADLIAQWLLSHPPKDLPRVLYALIDTTQDRVNQLLDERDQETRH
jgi:hypothetical protein